MDNYLLSYNAKRAAIFGKPLTKMDRLILLRSRWWTHSEYQFSERYGGYCWSATLRDNAKCVRFKSISIKRHPERWDLTRIPMTDLEEDHAWQIACIMADLPIDWLQYPQDFAFFKEGGCYYGNNPVKYDVWGQGCHATRLKLWKPNEAKTWCSKAVARPIFAAKGIAPYPKLWKLHNEIMPDELDMLVRHYFREE